MNRMIAYKFTIMRLVVLTGGVGTGQEEAVKLLLKAKIAVIDQNLINQNLLKPSTKSSQVIMKNFDHLISPNGEFNQSVFFKEVLSVPSQRIKYEKLIRPYLIQEFMKKIFFLWIRNERVIVLLVPRFFEEYVGPYFIFNEILTISSDKEHQFERLTKAGASDPQSLINNEIPIQYKRSLSTTVIENNSEEELETQINNLINKWKTTKVPFYHFPTPLRFLFGICLFIFLIYII